MDRRVVALPFAALVLASAVSASACGSTAETTIDVTGPTAVRCQPTLSSPSTSFGPSGGTGTVAVSIARECTWTATASAGWIVLTSGQQGQGDGTVAYRINENADPVARRGAITIAEAAVQLGQEPAPCRYRVSAGETTVPAAGGDLTIDVGAHTACSWTASTNASWASPSPSSGNGNGAVRVRVTPNTGQLRSADVTVAGERVTVQQNGQAGPPAPRPPSPAPPPPAPPPPVSCDYKLSSGSASFEAAGGTGSVKVVTTSGCAWAARSSASWVTISGPVQGTGNAEIRYFVAENFSTSERSGTITIATDVHRVTQEQAREIELEGTISALAGTCPNLRFTVEGRTVVTDSHTEFRDGRCSDARNGKDVDVKGWRQPNGTVTARRVEFDD